MGKLKATKLDKMDEKHFFETNNLSNFEGDNQWSAINGSDNVIISVWAIYTTASINAAGLVCGTICNILVIMTIAMTKKLLNTSINRAVLNLCIADLLVILIDVPLTSIVLVGNYNHFLDMFRPYIFHGYNLNTFNYCINEDYVN